MTKALVAGAGGFIGGHLVKSLQDRGYEVVAADIKHRNNWYQVHDDVDIADRMDLRLPGPCWGATFQVDRVYNLAADMGGMGFIASHRVDCMKSALININLMEEGFKGGIDRFFYASSACVYPDFMQDVTDISLKEDDAWPADPEPGYGLEKLYGEQFAKYYMEEKGLTTRVARFHNIFGPKGAWEGGREKAPAAICRKVAEAVISGDHTIEIWGDGEQTRSFLYIDECVEGIHRIMDSDVPYPLNLGSDELVSINQLVTMTEEIAGVKLERTYNLTQPQGVRGRNSDNELIKGLLGWAPSAQLVDGMEKTFKSIYDEVKAKT